MTDAESTDVESAGSTENSGCGMIQLERRLRIDSCQLRISTVDKETEHGKFRLRRTCLDWIQRLGRRPSEDTNQEKVPGPHAIMDAEPTLLIHPI
jgi:hypothetical protein